MGKLDKILTVGAVLAVGVYIGVAFSVYALFSMVRFEPEGTMSASLDDVRLENGLQGEVKPYQLQTAVGVR